MDKGDPAKGTGYSGVDHFDGRAAIFGFFES